MLALVRCVLLTAPTVASAVDMHLRLELLGGEDSMLDILAADTSPPRLTWELPSGAARQTRAVITLDQVPAGEDPVLTANVDGADQNATLAVAGLLKGGPPSTR